MTMHVSVFSLCASFCKYRQVKFIKILLFIFITDTTSLSSCIHWELSESCSPFTPLCHLYADLECTPWGSPTSTTCRLTTITSSSSSCCPIFHVRIYFLYCASNFFKTTHIITKTTYKMVALRCSLSRIEDGELEIPSVDPSVLWDNLNNK